MYEENGRKEGEKGNTRMKEERKKEVDGEWKEMIGIKRGEKGTR